VGKCIQVIIDHWCITISSHFGNEFETTHSVSYPERVDIFRFQISQNFTDYIDQCKLNEYIMYDTG